MSSLNAKVSIPREKRKEKRKEKGEDEMYEIFGMIKAIERLELSGRMKTSRTILENRNNVT